jgi:hypothetical protein
MHAIAIDQQLTFPIQIQSHLITLDVLEKITLKHILVLGHSKQEHVFDDSVLLSRLLLDPKQQVEVV